MDRRNFFKIVSAVSATVAADSCGKKSDALIPLLVPEHEIAPGEEQWHPSVCSECSAGCGVIVRVMEGERTIERNGGKFRERIACVKKIEGNPLDPVSGGRLCARGHAALQSLYNPDRVRGPLRRTAARGNAGFTAVSWDEAIAGVAERLREVRANDPSKILFLTAAPQGTQVVDHPTLSAVYRRPARVYCFACEPRCREKSSRVGLWLEGRTSIRFGASALCAWSGRGFFRRLGLSGLLRAAVWPFPAGTPRHTRKTRPGRIQNVAHCWKCRRMASVAPWFRATFPCRYLALFAGREARPQCRNNCPSVTDSILGANLAGFYPPCRESTRKNLRRVARELGRIRSSLRYRRSFRRAFQFAACTCRFPLPELMLGNVGQPGGSSAAACAPTLVRQSRTLPGLLKRSRIVLLDGENPVYSLPPSERSH